MGALGFLPKVCCHLTLRLWQSGSLRPFPPREGLSAPDAPCEPEKNRGGTSKKAKIGRNINRWASTSPSWAQGGILLLLTEVIPWLPPSRISCVSQAPSGACSQLWARAPGSQLLAAVNPKLKAKFSRGKKKMRVL